MQLLRCVGFSVQSAENGAAAIRVWEEQRPEMILMDVHMPVMDGLEATRRIKADPRGKGTVIVALTASALDEDRRIITASGADHFLAKPCLEDELFEAIRRLLHVNYDYENGNADDGGEAVDPVALVSKGLEQLAPELRQQLHDAIASGKKREIDQAILRVGESGDICTANALGQLAGKYAYDTLMQLLGEA
jgi:CheY-like chemotaxis protein